MTGSCFLYFSVISGEIVVVSGGGASVVGASCVVISRKTIGIRTALSTLRSLLVPKALRRSGVGAARALEVYGVVGGMVMPVLTFSSVFFLALAEQLIPALTRAQVRRDRTELEAT